MPYGSQTAQYAVAQSPGMAQTFKALQDAGYGQGASAAAPQQNMRPTFEKPTIYTVRISNPAYRAQEAKSEGRLYTRVSKYMKWK